MRKGEIMRITIFGWHPNHFVVFAVALALLVSVSVITRPKEELRSAPVFPAPICTGPTKEQIERLSREQRLAALEHQIRTKEKDIERIKTFSPEGPVHDELLEHYNRRIEELNKRKQALLEPKQGRPIKFGKVEKK